MALGAALLVVSGVFAPATAQGESSEFNYVALGDSYSAGYGLGDYELDSPFSVAPDANGCYQSVTNDPHQVAATLGLVIDDQTCSGAITANIGYGDETIVPTPSLTPPASKTLPALPSGPEQQTTLTGHLAPQLQGAALDEDTDLVTVAIGGNDLGFADIAESCIRLDNGAESVATGLQAITDGVINVANCADYFGDSSEYPEAILSDRIADVVQARIGAVLDDIQQRAPNARVIVVGYPRVATDDQSAADGCWASPVPPSPEGGVVPFSGTDIIFIHNVEVLLDAAVQAAAAAHGFEFVSSWAATEGHGLCDPDPWIFGLDTQWPTDSQCPADFQPLGYDGNVYACAKLGALHPNQDGVDALTTVVEEGISNTAMLKTGDRGVVPAGAALSVNGLGFEPGETVDLVLHSTPVTIGTPVAGAAGTIAGAFTVPGSVTPGAHTLVATGQSSERSVSVTVTVPLGPTGADAAVPAGAGLVLLLTGIALIAARRRLQGNQ